MLNSRSRLISTQTGNPSPIPFDTLDNEDNLFPDSWESITNPL